MKLKDCLWHCSLTHFLLCDIYFRNPAGQAKTVKTKAGLQMLKPSACMRAWLCACIRTANELVSGAGSTCSPWLNHWASPFHHLYPPRDKIPGRCQRQCGRWKRDVMSLSAHCGLSFTRMWSPRETLLSSDRGTEELGICAGPPLYTHFYVKNGWHDYLNVKTVGIVMNPHRIITQPCCFLQLCHGSWYCPEPHSRQTHLATSQWTKWIT